jgi:N-acetylglutamate synthase-like GNAT family acetyltransferase
MSSMTLSTRSSPQGHPLKVEVISDIGSVTKTHPMIFNVLQDWQKNAEQLCGQAFFENRPREVNAYRSSLIVSRGVEDLFFRFQQSPQVDSKVAFLCLDAKEQIQGCCVLECPSKLLGKEEAEISALVVNPIHIRRSCLTNEATRISGIGGSLLKSAEDFCEATTYPETTRLVVNSALSAVSFYTKEGYIKESSCAMGPSPLYKWLNTSSDPLDQ